MNYIIAFIAISIIIFFHELGHFILAKKTGMKVERFGLGMGPVIQVGKFKLAFTKNDTEYCLCWFPIGGFCQIKGEEEDSIDEDSYNAKPPISKFLVAFSGPFANILVTWLILVILFSLIGDPLKSQIAELKPGYPAIAAGLKVNDLIIGVNGDMVQYWSKIQPIIAKSIGKEITLNIIRDNKEIEIPVVPVENLENKPKIDPKAKDVKKYVPVGVVGMLVKPSNQTVSFGKAILNSFQLMGQFFVEFLRFFGMLFAGRIKFADVGGIVQILKIGGDTVKYSMSAFIFFMAFLSLNLSIINLFPFPPLDGGKIIFALIEAISRKKVNKKVEIWINTAGFALLMGLIILVSIKDILGLFIKK